MNLGRGVKGVEKESGLNRVAHVSAHDAREENAKNVEYARTLSRTRSRLGAPMREVFSKNNVGVLGYARPDYAIIAIAVVLSLIGLVFIYSASSYSSSIQFSDAFHYVKTQAVALLLGIFAMIFLSMTDVENIKKISPILYVLGLVLLSLVFVPILGVESYGAKRWLNLGFFTIQPSEYAKFFMVIAISAFASRADMRKFFNVLLVLALGGAVCVLLILEPNMSITICVASVIFIMLFASGAKTAHLVCLLIPAVFAVVALVLLEPYRLQRLIAFLDPWSSPLDEGYQLIQSYYALGSGGLFGVGLFASRQKYLFLPFAESDFILSVIGEETGLIGVACVVALFALYVVRGVKIAKRARDRFSCYLALGISAITGVQALVNVAVVCGAIPPTGLPLPFVSAGGSSLVAYLCATGVLVSISKNSAPYIKIQDFSSRKTA